MAWAGCPVCMLTTFRCRCVNRINRFANRQERPTQLLIQPCEGFPPSQGFFLKHITQDLIYLVAESDFPTWQSALG